MNSQCFGWLTAWTHLIKVNKKFMQYLCHVQAFKMKIVGMAAFRIRYFEKLQWRNWEPKDPNKVHWCLLSFKNVHRLKLYYSERSLCSTNSIISNNSIITMYSSILQLHALLHWSDQYYFLLQRAKSYCLVYAILAKVRDLTVISPLAVLNGIPSKDATQFLVVYRYWCC